MSNENINLKKILEQPFAKLGLILGGMALFFILFFSVVGTQYDVDKKGGTICILTFNCHPTNVDGDPTNLPPDHVNPLSASLISGGVSTVGLGLLIGIGVLDFPIILALAGGAVIFSATYSALQFLS